MVTEVHSYGGSLTPRLSRDHGLLKLIIYLYFSLPIVLLLCFGANVLIILCYMDDCSQKQRRVNYT